MLMGEHKFSLEEDFNIYKGTACYKGLLLVPAEGFVQGVLKK